MKAVDRHRGSGLRSSRLNKELEMVGMNGLSPQIESVVVGSNGGCDEQRILAIVGPQRRLLRQEIEVVLVLVGGAACLGGRPPRAQGPAAATFLLDRLVHLYQKVTFFLAAAQAPDLNLGGLSFGLQLPALREVRRSLRRFVEVLDLLDSEFGSFTFGAPFAQSGGGTPVSHDAPERLRVLNPQVLFESGHSRGVLLLSIAGFVPAFVYDHRRIVIRGLKFGHLIIIAATVDFAKIPKVFNLHDRAPLLIPIILGLIWILMHILLDMHVDPPLVLLHLRFIKS